MAVTPRRPVRIVWLDHHEPENSNVWWSPDDLTELDGPCVVETVGFILRDEQGWLAVAGQITEDGYTSQPLVIVKSCIMTMKDL